MLHFLDTTAGTVTSISVLATVGLGGLGWLAARLRKAGRRVMGGLDVLVGRDAIYDRATGRELAPPMLGIGHRMDVQEANTADLRSDVSRVVGAFERMVDNVERLDRFESRLVVVEDRLGIETAVVLPIASGDDRPRR